MPEADRKQILSDEVHVGGPPAAGGRLHCVLLFPNRYALGMANLGFQTLYRLLSSHPDISCERAFFLPTPDGASEPLRSLETHTPVARCGLLGISSSFELDWLRIPMALEAAGIPPLAADRERGYPLVLIGGPAVTANPEPIADLADAIFIGEVEEVFPDLAATLLEGDLGAAEGRADLLNALGSLPGVYIPSQPVDQPVRRVALEDVNMHQTRTKIISPYAEFPDSFLLEVSRGCPRGCRFCLARQIYQPPRPRTLESLLATAEVGLQYTDRVRLVGAAVADHPDLPALARTLVDLGARIATSSLRAERVTPELVEPIAASGQRTITLAPETADERLAKCIGKRMSRETVHAAIAAALDAGINRVRLYFMIGLPGETDAEALSIADYVSDLEGEFSQVRFAPSISPLIPKAHTELARVAVPDIRTLRHRLKAVGKALRAKTHTRARLGSARWSAVQVALSRGGRELTPVLMAAARAGGRAGDFFSALKREGLALEDYLGPQPDDAPWQVVDPSAFYAREARDE